MSMVDAASCGDRLEEMKTLRNVLATAIDESAESGNAHDLSSLTDKYLSVSREISEIEKTSGKRSMRSSLDKIRTAANAR